MFFSKLLIAAGTLAVVAAQTLSVITPAALVQCQPVALAFSGASAPFYLSIIPGGQLGATALVNFGSVTSSPYTWTVNLAAGTSITLRITDSTGNSAYSAPVTIQAGTSSACLTSSVVAGTVAATGAIGSAAATGSTPATTGAVASASASASAAGSVVGSASAAASSVAASVSAAVSPSATSAANTKVTSSFGLAGFMLAAVGVIGGAALLL